jgi:hypothetical protein
MKTQKVRTVFILFGIISIVLLIWAYSNHSTEFYFSLRLAVCITCLYGAYYAKRLTSVICMGAMFFIAVLYNPVEPIYFEKNYWNIIDNLTALFLLLSFFLLPRSQKLSAESKGTNERNLRDLSCSQILWGMYSVVIGYLFWYYMLNKIQDWLWWKTALACFLLIAILSPGISLLREGIINLQQQNRIDRAKQR